MKYPEWWERLVAAVIDGVIVGIPVSIVYVILTSILIGATSGTAMLFIVGLIGGILMFVAMVAYKVYFEAGKDQATIGKKVFGLKVVTDSGGAADRNIIIIRAWPWYIGAVNLIVVNVPIVGLIVNLALGILGIVAAVMFFFAPVGRCLQDTMTNMHVIKASEGMIGGTK